MPRQNTFGVDDDGDLFDEWFSAKSRNKKLSASIKYPTGSTYSNIFEKDRLLANTDATIMYRVGSAPPRVKQVLEDSNLLIEPLEYTVNSSSALAVANVRNSSLQVAFSMNKKNRWQLPRLVEQRIEELRNEQFDAGFHLTAVLVGNSDGPHQRGRDANYFSVTSTNPSVKNLRYSTAVPGGRRVRLNPASIDEMLNQRQERLFRWRPRRDRHAKRVVDLVKYFSRKRRAFKGGNRDRNSGIRRENETFLVSDEAGALRNEDDEIQDYTFNLSFYKPDRILKTKRVNHSLTKLGYGSKFHRTHHFYAVRSRARQLKRYERHSNRIQRSTAIRNDTREASEISDEMACFHVAADRNGFDSSYEPTGITVNIDEMVRSGRTSAPIPQLGTPKSRSTSSLAIDDDAAAKSHVVYVEADDPAFLWFQPRKFKAKPVAESRPATVTMPTPLARIEFQVEDASSFGASMTPERLRAITELVRISYETRPSKLIISLDGLLSKRLAGTSDHVLARLFTSGSLATFMILDTCLGHRTCFNLNSRLGKNQTVSLEAFVRSELAAAQIKFSAIEQLVEFVVDRVARYIDSNVSYDDSSDLATQKTGTQHSKSRLGRLACIDKQSFNDSYLKLMVQSLERRDTKAAEKPGLNDSSFMNTDSCPICYADIDDDQNYLVGLSECGHAACVQCWLSFVHTSIYSLKTSGQAEEEKSSLRNFRKLTCLHYKCQTALSLSFLSTLVSPDLIDKYVQFNKDIYLMANKDVVYCKNDKCNRLLLINEDRLGDFNVVESISSSKDVVLECECGYLVCKLCLKESHFPALCSQASAYAKELEKQQAKARLPIDTDESLYESEGKNCPNCGNYMEKNGGCNHMSCVCGNHYCWVCLKPFSYSGHTCSSPVATVRYESWNFFTSRTRNSFYRQNLDQLMMVQRAKRLKVNDLYLKRKHAFKVYLSAFKELANPSSEMTQIVKKSLSDDQLQDLHPSAVIGRKLEFLNTFVHHEFDRTIENLRKHYHLNEYLALLFNSKRSENKYFCINNYSFKSNILQSLRKSVALAERLEEIHQNAKNHRDLTRMVRLNAESLAFSQNLKHLILNSLDLYTKSGLVC